MRAKEWHRKGDEQARRESYRNYLRDYYLHLLVNEQLSGRLDNVEQFLSELSSLQELGAEGETTADNVRPPLLH